MSTNYHPIETLKPFSKTSKAEVPQVSSFEVIQGGADAKRFLVYWGKYPQLAFCPDCTTEATTLVRHRRATAAWMSCLGISIIGFNCGCCLLPFFINDLLETHHHCATCQRLLGIKKPFS